MPRNDTINPSIKTDNILMRTLVLLEIPNNATALALVEKLMEEISGTIHETCITDPLAKSEYATIEFLRS